MRQDVGARSMLTFLQVATAKVLPEALWQFMNNWALLVMSLQHILNVLRIIS